MDEYLTVAEAARLLGVVPATVRQMERVGRLPALRTAGGVRFFRKGDVARLAEVRRTAVLAKGGAVPATNEHEEGR
jgi:excisionase family DNA binding protein